MFSEEHPHLCKMELLAVTAVVNLYGFGVFLVLARSNSEGRGNNDYCTEEELEKLVHDVEKLKMSIMVKKLSVEIYSSHRI